MPDPIVLRNDVPMLERLLALFFIAVGAPLTYLGYTDADSLPEVVVPVVQIGLPLFLVAVVWWAFIHRRRLLVTLEPGDPVAHFEERVLFFTKGWTAHVTAVDIEMGEDIDGDPYGSLVLRLEGRDDVVAAEGNDLETLEGRRSTIQDWLHRLG